VRHNGGEVEIHAEGPAEHLADFGNALLSRAPPAAAARLLTMRAAGGEFREEFRILPSVTEAELRVHVPADLFMCDECLAELSDPSARRYCYPFINCTQCGPRYTLIRAMPYDRANTTLDRFALCHECAADYADPLDRRFHAEPLACAACGPSLYWNDGHNAISGNAPALAAAVACLEAERIIAVRGVGGYHLLCDARSEKAVMRLRLKKGRPSKPLAVMFPWRGRDGLDYGRGMARLSTLDADALRGAARPIVLIERGAATPFAPSIAPGLREIALMLPYSPLHHLLIEEFGAALVMTSANLSGEPVLTEPAEVQSRLAAVADGFLHHDRPIARPADDSVMRVLAGAARPIRLGRGTAPLELNLPLRAQTPILAVGGYQKTTISLAWGDRAVVSPHIGELSSPRGREVFAQVVRDLQQLYGVRAARIVHDAHPGFPNTRWARGSGLPAQAVWHHHAHASAVAGEYPSDVPLLCFTWDGVGLGPDGTLWGGEALLGCPGAWKRVASFRPFRLPGGERAAREPWRAALALCWECGEDWPQGSSLGDPLLHTAWSCGVNTPTTTSAGRLFDAAAALIGVCLYASYEGEAPMRLESLCMESASPVVLPLARDAAGVWRSDWAALLPALLSAQHTQASRAAAFHASMAQTLCDQAVAVRKDTGVTRVGLSGGVFQNRVLTEQAQGLLTNAGFEVLIPQLLPVNDAAISFGQLVEAIAIRGTYFADS
jgi:hydrogenase maturation protein HypF